MQIQPTHASVAASTPAKELTLSNKSQIFSAAALGLLIIMGIGFAPMDIVHNAAHDTRHSMVFPCH